MSATEKAPGLKWIGRRNGSRIPYWVARQDYVKAGYRPKSVRLHYQPGDPAIVTRCHMLQQEMLAWSQERGVGRPAQYDGTVESLVRMYETHGDSPYFDLEPESKINYSAALRIYIVRHKGDKRVDCITGNDVKRWAKELLASGLSTTTVAHAINVFKAVLAFGSSLRIMECTTLRTELRATRFQGGRRRTQQITYEQVVMLRNKARDFGYHYLARVLTLQFDFALRRRDVIGRYLRDVDGIDGIRFHGRVWTDGLTWADKDADGIIRRVVSKTRRTSGKVAVHAIADYPDVQEDLDRTPPEQRIGPLVLHDRTGVPPTEEQCRRHFRRIARACGLPDAIKQMDARAGADTEAYECGVSTEDAMALLTHSEVKTNRGYLRETLEQSRRAARQRVASRKK